MDIRLFRVEGESRIEVYASPFAQRRQPFGERRDGVLAGAAGGKSYMGENSASSWSTLVRMTRRRAESIAQKPSSAPSWMKRIALIHEPMPASSKQSIATHASRRNLPSRSTAKRDGVAGSANGQCAR